MNRAWVETDYYDVLGVAHGASRDEIRRAYRKLAQQHHPDANQGDEKAEERFKEVSEAYAVLSDDDKRKEYDEVRRLVGSGAFSNGAGGFGPGFGGQQVRVEDLGGLFGGMGGFGDLFGGATTRSRGPRKGRDVRTSVAIDFEESILGTEKQVRLTGDAPCSRCSGSGAEPGTSKTICSTCSGAGQVSQSQGFFAFAQPCPQCAGSGQTISTPCTTCRGSGAERRTRTITVKIPAGVVDGGTVRAKGKGGPGRDGGPAGDLHITVQVRPHPRFGRKGDHLTVHVPVSFPDAALGTQVEAPTLDGPVRLRVPAGTQPGAQFRVKGKGVPRRAGRTGDLIVTVDVAVPTKLSRKAKKALAEFASLSGDDVSPDEEDTDER